jgi:hypothetical protein
MPQKNQMTNDDQGQQGTVEAQVPESRNSENQAAELNAQTTNMQSAQEEGDLSAHQGSTGPRTALGKKRSSQNAIKFGVFSRATLLTGESRSEYQRLLEGMWKTWQPEGELEEILVDKLVSTTWRHRRLLVAEGAEIRKYSEFLEFDRRRKEQEEAEEISQRRQAGQVDELSPRSLLMGQGPTPESIGLIWNILNPDILERCIELLLELQKGIETDGLDEDQDGLLLTEIYGELGRPHLRRTLHDTYSCLFGDETLTERQRKVEEVGRPKECKLTFLRKLGAEINRLKQYQEKCGSVESERMKVEIRRQSVPDSRAQDRLLRYEGSLERAFDRALTQLERVQRMRKGQSVLPPIKVDVSS